jgi:hypothetical protein
MKTPLLTEVFVVSEGREGTIVPISKMKRSQAEGDPTLCSCPGGADKCDGHPALFGVYTKGNRYKLVCYDCLKKFMPDLLDQAHKALDDDTTAAGNPHGFPPMSKTK